MLLFSPLITTWSGMKVFTKDYLIKIYHMPDLNYVEDSAGGPDVTVGILPTLDKVTLLQVCLKFSSSFFSLLISQLP